METYRCLISFTSHCLGSGTPPDQLIDWTKCKNFVIEKFPQVTWSSEMPPPFIPMVGDAVSERLMENIALCFKRQELPIRLETIEIIQQYYETKFVKGAAASRTFQIGLEVLYIFSRLNVDEFKHFYYYSPSADKLYSGKLHDLVGDISTWTEESVYLNDVKAEEIRAFLQKPRLVRALIYCLEKRFERQFSVDWVTGTIKTMKIYFIDSTATKLRGVTLRDGILIYYLKLVLDTSKTLHCHRADLMTLTLHETSNYLARSFVGDYSFSSPVYCLNAGARYQDNVAFTHGRTENGVLKVGSDTRFLELGRAVEIVLFDGEQPDWLDSSEEAAQQFFIKVDADEQGNTEIPSPSITQSDFARRSFRKLDTPPISGALQLSVQRFYIY